MLLLLASLTLMARAQTFLAPCQTPYVSEVLPSNGASGVPIDVQPVVLIADGGCGGEETFSFSLYLLDDSEAEVPLAELTQTWSASAPGEVLRLEPELLTENTAYLLRIMPSSGELSELSFTTSAEGTVGLGDASPTVVSGEATWDRDGGLKYLRQSWSSVPVADPDGLSIVQWRDAEGEALGVQSTAGRDVVDFYRSETVEDVPDQVCASFVQFDGAGRASAPSEDCVSVVRDGCSSAGGSASLSGLLLVLLGLRRRR